MKTIGVQLLAIRMGRRECGLRGKGGSTRTVNSIVIILPAQTVHAYYKVLCLRLAVESSRRYTYQVAIFIRTVRAYQLVMLDVDG